MLTGVGKARAEVMSPSEEAGSSETAEWGTKDDAVSFFLLYCFGESLSRLVLACHNVIVTCGRFCFVLFRFVLFCFVFIYYIN